MGAWASHECLLWNGWQNEHAGETPVWRLCESTTCHPDLDYPFIPCITKTSLPSSGILLIFVCAFSYRENMYQAKVTGLEDRKGGSLNHSVQVQSVFQNRAERKQKRNTRYWGLCFTQFLIWTICWSHFSALLESVEVLLLHTEGPGMSPEMTNLLLCRNTDLK